MIHEIQNIGNAVNGVEVATVSRISNGVIVITLFATKPQVVTHLECGNEKTL